MISDIEMDRRDPGRLTGSRLDRFISVIKNAPRDPSCGCIKVGDTAWLLIDALFAEQDTIDMEIDNGETKTKGEP